MNSIYSKFQDDFLEGSETIYNYDQSPDAKYLFAAQIVGIQNIGPNYYNELAMAKEFQIQYTISGRGLATVNDEKIMLKAGDLLIISNYHHHIFKPVPGENWQIAFIHIYDNDSIMELFTNIYRKHRYLIPNVQADHIVPYIRAIITLYKDNAITREERDLQISSLIYQLIMQICNESNIAYGQTINKKLAGVISFIDQNFNTPIMLKDILEHSTYSKTHLQRLFKKEKNMSVQEYVSSLRLKRAEELILKTNAYFNEIATQVGLGDYRALYYLFVKYKGMTPTEFKKQYTKR